ncbi:hypothetical protein A3C17_00910 [Candidatus Uhrbacteria bacterium RIFCSPHIGHO2_02_FULL_53_13]|uniref:DUF4325 domain-containing protein n=1 Tax=Candidatus Uhrbacteria bacterium RIFCSPHIGHO2_02_FULL_53_13 TaxID=1802389 RepID=A0A1F7U0Z8_9BACT|nr:MAG: hypothetical protein A3C17_00910 [Candidatus Uhrbacteria bacterium RIFCSPHIGHO2_02_FULL_53_13]
MQIIHVKKFGDVLISRSAGLEAFGAIRPQLNPGQIVQIDFEGILTVTPSWLDEFLTHLTDYVGETVEIIPTHNASVLAILPTLAEARQDLVAKVAVRAMKEMEKK